MVPVEGVGPKLRRDMAWREAIDAGKKIDLDAADLDALIASIGALQLAVGNIYGAVFDGSLVGANAVEDALNSLKNSVEHSEKFLTLLSEKVSRPDAGE